MNRMGIVVIALALVAGCGSSDEKTEAEATTAAPKIGLADTCPKVQDALDESFKSGAALPDAAEYADFADDITTLAIDVDPKGEPLLDSLLDATIDLRDGTADGLRGSELVDLRGVWFDVMKRVTDTCQQLGAPLR